LPFCCHIADSCRNRNMLLIAFGGATRFRARVPECVTHWTGKASIDAENNGRHYYDAREGSWPVVLASLRQQPISSTRASLAVAVEASKRCAVRHLSIIACYSTKHRNCDCQGRQVSCLPHVMRSLAICGGRGGRC
jgi:hypothetical protein